MAKWYVWIDGRYHITRTNIAECQCECGKQLSSGLDLKTSVPTHLICNTYETRFNPLPMGGKTSLPHHLEAENNRMRAALVSIYQNANYTTGRDAVQTLLDAGLLKQEDCNAP